MKNLRLPHKINPIDFDRMLYIVVPTATIMAVLPILIWLNYGIVEDHMNGVISHTSLPTQMISITSLFLVFLLIFSYPTAAIAIYILYTLSKLRKAIYLADALLVAIGMGSVFSIFHSFVFSNYPNSTVFTELPFYLGLSVWACVSTYFIFANLWKTEIDVAEDFNRSKGQ